MLALLGSRIASALRKGRVLPVFLAVAVALGTAYVPAPLMALAGSTFVVNSTVDSVDIAPGNGICADSLGRCTLRAAIMEANALVGADTIIIPAGTYTLTIPGINENAAAAGDLDITDAVTIIGAGGNPDGDPALTIIQAGTNATNGIDKVFSINPTFNKAFATAIKAVTIRYGHNMSLTSSNSYGGGLDWDAFGTGTLDIYNSVITDNKTDLGYGGGIALTGWKAGQIPSVTITKSVIANNTVATKNGGGIFVGNNMPINITDSTIIGNTSPAGAGGGIMLSGQTSGLSTTISGTTIANNSAGGASGQGGGIYLTRPISIINSAISGNTADQDGGGIKSSQTAGLAVTLTNVTISGNSAKTDGGGISQALQAGAVVTLTNTTLTLNRADADGNGTGVGGGIHTDVAAAGGNMLLRNTLVAGNIKGIGAIASDIENGSFLNGASDYNLIGTGGSGGLIATNGNQVGVASPGLGPLANNGGLTQTHALLPGSPALEAGNNVAVSVTTTTDQRGTGYPRIADSNDAGTFATVDIGAYEAHPTMDDITDKTMIENTSLAIPFNVGDGVLGFSSISANSSNAVLVPNGAATVTGSGDTRTLTITPATGELGTATITVTVTSATSAATATDTFVLTVNGAPDLTIGKSHIGNFTQGQTGATYTLAVSNIGRGATSGIVTVTDTLPGGLTATTIVGTGWSCTLGTLTCTRSDALNIGGSYPNITVTVDVAANAPSSVTNSASVSGGGDSSPGNNTASNLTTVIANTTLVVSPITPVSYPGNPVITVTLTESVGSTGLNGKPVTVVINGQTYPLTTNASGVATVTYSGPTLNTGIYPVTASFAGDATYNISSDNSKSAVVDSAATSITLIPATQTVAWGQVVTLTAILTPNVAGKPIVFTQGATTLCTVLTDAAAQAVCNPTGLLGSGLTVTATFAGDTNYVGSSTNATVTVNKADTTLVVSAITPVTYPGNPVITVTATENVNSTGLNGKPVTVTINGQIYPLTTNATGVATVTYSGPTLNAGSYLVTASFAGDANYNTSSDNTKSAVINQSTTSMTLTPATQTVTWGQTVTLTATLTPNLAGKSILFTQGATTLCTVLTDAAGQAICNPTGLMGSGLTVTATFAGDTNYAGSAVSATVTVNKADTTLVVSAIAPVTYPGNPVITVTLTENVGSTGLNGKPVTVVINGQTYTPTTNASGVATVTYSGPTLNAGSYPVTATFTGDANYNTSSDNSKSAVVNQSTTSMTLTPATQTVTWGQTVTLTATLTPNVSGKSVLFTQGATTICTVVTDASGQAVCNPTGLMGSGLTVTATFAGDTNYLTSSASATVTVNKADTTLVVSSIAPVTYPGNPVITVTLTENVGSTGLNNKPVTVVINGLTYTPTTNASGVATVIYSGPTLNAGSYPVTATFTGDANYNTSSDNSKSAVVNQSTTSMTLTPATQTITWGQTVTLTATLTPNLSGKSVLFTQGATTLCTVLTDAAGQVICNPTGLMGSGLTVTATFAGDTNYAGSFANATVTVNKAGTTLVVSPIAPVAYPGNPVITVTLTETVNSTGLNGKTVTVVINGQTYTPTTNASGVATVTYSGPTLNAGSYPVTASYAGDVNYNTSSDNSKSAVVNPNTTSMTLTPATQTVTYGQTVTLTATLTPNVAGKSIVFTQGATTLCTVLTDATGKAVCSSTSLMGSGLTVTATFAGDTSYVGSSANATVTVNKATTTLVVSAIAPVTYPGNPVITVTLTENAGGAGLSGKTVTVVINGKIYNATTNASGVATVTYSGPTLNTGSYPVGALLVGDVTSNPSFDISKTAVVKQNPTSMTLTPATQTVTWGQTVTLTATLAPNVAGKLIVFKQGAKTLCKIATDASGQAVCSPTTLIGGPLTVTASFAGDTNYAGSSATATVTVTIPARP